MVNRFNTAKEVSRPTHGEETSLNNNQTVLAADETNAVETSPPERSEGTRRVLIVEDNATARKQIEIFLETDPDLSVDGAANGADALKAIREQAYSVVVTDLKMPELDGIQLLEEVQKSEDPAAVIITTGYGTIDDAVLAMRMGATDFLTKPINLEHLRLVVHRRCATVPCGTSWPPCAENSSNNLPSRAS